MNYLDHAKLEAMDAAAFQARDPYPWVNPEGVLTPESYRRLHEFLPDIAMFEPQFGKSRKHGQQSHDRYTLEYSDGLDIPQLWQEFIDELNGAAYRDFLRHMLGINRFVMNFHWHYTPNGGSVSPHCDARQKHGSHIFYFNTEEDWDPAWGGETLILDDGGRFNRRSAPNFEDFLTVTPSEAIGNRSLLFARRGKSWHGVREIHCPPDRMRQVFIVVINSVSPMARVRRFLGGKPRFFHVV